MFLCEMQNKKNKFLQNIFTKLLIYKMTFHPIAMAFDEWLFPFSCSSIQL
jgi:hypothetical protein